MIDNEFIEKLEELALERKKCEIIFTDAGGKVIVNEVIDGIYEREEGLSLQLSSGKEVLLSKLLRVDGIAAEILS